MSRAGKLAEEAISAGAMDPPLFCLAAGRRSEAGDKDGAVRYSLKAVELAPYNALFLTCAGDALRYTGQLRDAIAMFDRALAIDPMMVAAWYGRSLALASAGLLDDAARGYRRVAELAPSAAHGFSGLASIQAQLGEIALARENIRQAIAIAPHDPSTILARARCDIAGGHYEAAATGLKILTARSDITGTDQVVAFGLLGDALDKIDNTEDAYEAYSRANHRFAEIHAGPNAPPVATALVESIVAKLDDPNRLRLSVSATSVDNEASQHIFVLGFPRSGTTLVEQILATGDSVETLEESPTLAEAQNRFLSGDGMDALASADENELAQLRSVYWEKVKAYGIVAAGKTFVDMDPFKSVSLPLIARLFPKAKIVVVRRDPRDVIWSCFRRNFVFSQATYEFTSLHRAARLFNVTETLVDRTVDQAKLDVHVVQYEQLVSDFDATTKSLFEFVNLRWTENVRDFSNVARTRPVKTASAYQVKRGLFDGTGQWRRYSRYLAPVMDIISPDRKRNTQTSAAE